MSVPFSNTHLRVPHGFGTILEGLTREVLRDQPEDIPMYAAQYFEALLKQREESGMDPSEWAAKLEDRFYNNHEFKNTRTSPEREETPEMNICKEKSCESQTEDESSHSAETSTLSTTQHHVSEQAASTDNTDEDEENIISEKRTVSTEPSTLSTTQHHVSAQAASTDNTDEDEENIISEKRTVSTEPSTLSTTQHPVSEQAASTESTDEDEENDITEKYFVSTETGLPERKSVADIQNNEASSADEEKDPAITILAHTDRPDKEIDSNPNPDPNIAKSDPQPAGLLSVGGTVDVDVCAPELGAAEDEGGDQLESNPIDEIIDSEKGMDTEVAEPVEIFPLSGLADVNVCATELGGTERAVEGETVQDDSHVKEEECWKAQVEETVVESFLPQSEITEGSQEKAMDQAQKTKGKEITETQASCGETNESLAHIEGALVDNITPKEDSLVEISFEDVPEAQRITPVGEKHPEEETSIDVIQTDILEMEQMEESKVLTASPTDQNLSHTEDPIEPEMEIVKEEFHSEGEEMESQHAAFDVMTETVVTNNSNLNDSDDGEEEKGVKSISSSDQPTTETEREIQEDETSYKSVDIDEVHKDKFDQSRDSEKETQPNDPGFTEEMACTGGVEEEEICTEVCNEMGEEEMNDDKMESDPSKQTQSNTSTTGMEGETFEESVQQLPQENEESQNTLLESPEDRREEKEVTPKEAEEHAYGATDCEIQEKSKAMGKEEPISLPHTADWTAADPQEEERPAKSEDTTELASKSDEEECSRPQEEEDIMDIPLDDPEANRAAAKIQAGFRGHMTRKKMKPEDKTEGEEVSSTGDVLNGSQGVSETGRSGAVESDDTSVPEQ